MIVLTAGAVTDPQVPARASNVYTTDAWLGGIDRVASAGWCPPPQQKSWLRRCLENMMEIVEVDVFI